MDSEEGQLTYVGPADHVCRCPIERRERRIIEDLVREVDTEAELKQAEAGANGTVFTAQCLKGNHVGHHPALAVLGLLGDCVNVVLKMLQEAAHAPRARVFHQACSESILRLSAEERKETEHSLPRHLGHLGTVIPRRIAHDIQADPACAASVGAALFVAHFIENKQEVDKVATSSELLIAGIRVDV